MTLILALTLLASNWSAVKAQDQSYEYFSQTGHSVQGDFLKFYHAISDPTTIYGYPITEAFPSKDGNQVQYFQRARIEFHAE